MEVDNFKLLPDFFTRLDGTRQLPFPQRTLLSRIISHGRAQFKILVDELDRRTDGGVSLLMVIFIQYYSRSTLFNFSEQATELAMVASEDLLRGGAINGNLIKISILRQINGDVHPK